MHTHASAHIYATRIIFWKTTTLLCCQGHLVNHTTVKIISLMCTLSSKQLFRYDMTPMPLRGSARYKSHEIVEIWRCIKINECSENIAFIHF